MLPFSMKGVIKRINLNQGGFYLVNSEQVKLLSKMKTLIRDGKRKFQIRKDRDYIEELLDIGITEKEAWNHILELNKNFYIYDFKPIYAKTGEDLIFKKQVNGVLAYIKLKIEKSNNNEEVVCLSFHKDNN